MKKRRKEEQEEAREKGKGSFIGKEDTLVYCIVKRMLIIERNK